MSKGPGMELLKSNFNQVEKKFSEFFEKGQPRWPQEKHDLLRNHHRNVDNFSAENITFEKLGLIDLPENILRETRLAFEAFQKQEEYN